MQRFILFRSSVLWMRRVRKAIYRESHLQGSMKLLPDWAELRIPIPHAEMNLDDFWAFRESIGKLK